MKTDETLPRSFPSFSCPVSPPSPSLPPALANVRWLDPFARCSSQCRSYTTVMKTAAATRGGRGGNAGLGRRDERSNAALSAVVKIL